MAEGRRAFGMGEEKSAAFSAAAFTTAPAAVNTSHAERATSAELTSHDPTAAAACVTVTVTEVQAASPEAQSDITGGTARTATRPAPGWPRGQQQPGNSADQAAHHNDTVTDVAAHDNGTVTDVDQVQPQQPENDVVVVDDDTATSIAQEALEAAYRGLGS